ncbi:uncharacterized protein LOC133895111 [Phragmites australis]|uniref:uncharacterized protein LOC133895111 n=1 Tax=Phragmites australis TaxID=29695 RepID=UPI002D7898BF|nr:uncharacterized protein LOC133895111 [Phragmites australis]
MPAIKANSKAKNLIIQGLRMIDFDRVVHLKSAYEVWKTLCDYHEGSSTIKEILRNLHAVNVTYSDAENARQLLGALDMSVWEMKVTSIRESPIVSTLTLDILYSKLKTHELDIFARKNANKSIALISQPSISRKASKEEMEKKKHPFGDKKKKNFLNRKVVHQVLLVLKQINLSNVDSESSDDDTTSKDQMIRDLTVSCLTVSSKESISEDELDIDNSEVHRARNENIWLVDSRCSRHMSGNKNWFPSLVQASCAKSVTFGDASSSIVVAKGSYPPIIMIMTNASGQLLHLDIVGPSRVQSFGGLAWLKSKADCAYNFLQ